MIRKPQMQVEHMIEANVRSGYKAKRPTESLEAEEADRKKNRNPRTTPRTVRI